MFLAAASSLLFRVLLVVFFLHDLSSTTSTFCSASSYQPAMMASVALSISGPWVAFQGDRSAMELKLGFLMLVLQSFVAIEVALDTIWGDGTVNLKFFARLNSKFNKYCKYCLEARKQTSVTMVMSPRTTAKNPAGLLDTVDRDPESWFFSKTPDKNVQRTIMIKTAAEESANVRKGPREALIQRKPPVRKSQAQSAGSM
ncbi:hypothetical protein DFH06DRAFT_1132361 [Mycena polygramma]|nr:hypothetical protein DFH06DRAFT_1132361 [Mycena polygramma]